MTEDEYADLRQMLEKKEKNKGIRSAGKRFFKGKYEQYKQEAAERRQRKEMYKEELQRQRAAAIREEIRRTAKRDARKDARREVSGYSSGGFGSVFGKVGKIGQSAQKAGTGISNNFDSMLFGASSQPRRPSVKSKRRTPKRSKRRPRRSSGTQYNPFSFL